MTATPSQICWVAGHAWQDKQDQWGKWRECARCGTVVSASGWLPNRRVTPGLPRPLGPGSIVDGPESRRPPYWGLTAEERAMRDRIGLDYLIHGNDDA